MIQAFRGGGIGIGNAFIVLYYGGVLENDATPLRPLRSLHTFYMRHATQMYIDPGEAPETDQSFSSEPNPNIYRVKSI